MQLESASPTDDKELRKDSYIYFFGKFSAHPGVDRVEGQELVTG